jgi:isopenicillin N synthase-like dioxygenase
MEELTNNKIKSTIHRVKRFDSSNVLFFGKLEINTNLVCNETAR